MKTYKPFITLLACVLAVPALASEFYVAPDGNDSHSGSLKEPFATLEKARDAARTTKGSTIYLRGGTYFPEKVLTLTPVDSDLTIRAYNNETPILNGGRIITGWQPLETEPAGLTAAAQGKLWVAQVPKGWCFHYLYVQGQKTERARLHNTHWRKWPQDISYGEPQKDGQEITFENKKILQNLPSNGDVEMICIMAQYGVMGNGVMTHINPTAGTAEWNSKQTHVGFRTRRKNYTLDNALPFIDQPGEWCVDSQHGLVYYWPEKGDMEGSQAIAPKLYELIRLQGDETKEEWVENVTLSGLTLTYTDRLTEDQWPDSRVYRQWENVDAMIYLQGTKDCTLSDNRLLYSGSSGITLDHFCQGTTVAGNEIGWAGSSGVLLYGYGPGTLDVNKHNTITRNWIHYPGQGNYWHSATIQNYQSGHNHITLNLLQKSAYCSIAMAGVHPKYLSNPIYFFEDHPKNQETQFREWTLFGIRSQDFPKEIQDGVRNGTYRFTRDTNKPYVHTRNNVIEQNIIVEPEQMLDEGGAIYAWCVGKGNVWKDNLIFKSSGFPGASILALDDLAEFFTLTGNVIWVNGRATCGTIGMRPNERGNVIHGNIRAAVKPGHKDTSLGGNVNGLSKGFYEYDETRDPVYALQKRIVDAVNAEGGWLGNPDTGIPRPGEEIKNAVQRTLPEGSHIMIE